MEYFELAFSIEDIARLGTDEVINQWEDWIPSTDLTFFHPPVFTLEEQETIQHFHGAWETCANETMENIYDAKALSEIKCWQAFRSTAGLALSVFLKRGKFSDTKEEVGE